MMNCILYYTLLADGRVDVTFHECSPKGRRIHRYGQRITIAPNWKDALVFAPKDNAFVRVRVAR